MDEPMIPLSQVIPLIDGLMDCLDRIENTYSYIEPDIYKWKGPRDFAEQWIAGEVHRWPDEVPHTGQSLSTFQTLAKHMRASKHATAALNGMTALPLKNYMRKLFGQEPEEG